jgi:hypothetical protein
MEILWLKNFQFAGQGCWFINGIAIVNFDFKYRCESIYESWFDQVQTQTVKYLEGCNMFFLKEKYWRETGVQCKNNAYHNVNKVQNQSIHE